MPVGCGSSPVVHQQLWLAWAWIAPGPAHRRLAPGLQASPGLLACRTSGAPSPRAPSLTRARVGSRFGLGSPGGLDPLASFAGPGFCLICLVWLSLPGVHGWILWFAVAFTVRPPRIRVHAGGLLSGSGFSWFLAVVWLAGQAFRRQRPASQTTTAKPNYQLARSTSAAASSCHLPTIMGRVDFWRVQFGSSIIRVSAVQAGVPFTILAGRLARAQSPACAGSSSYHSSPGSLPPFLAAAIPCSVNLLASSLVSLSFFKLIDCPPNTGLTTTTGRWAFKRSSTWNTLVHRLPGSSLPLITGTVLSSACRFAGLNKFSLQLAPLPLAEY